MEEYKIARRWTVVAALSYALVCAARADVVVPDGFTVGPIGGPFELPTAIAFAPDGRLFVAQKNGVVFVVQEGNTLPQPFINLSAEVNDPTDRGMLGLALDPDFLNTRYVYLLYTVEMNPNQPDLDGEKGAVGRLVRYQGTLASNGNIADPASRTVLIGDGPLSGFPVCWKSHTVGALRFASDGTLLASAGEGAKFTGTDPGGLTPNCAPVLNPGEDLGAFRAQSLDSLAGKIIRIDPATGAGLPDNPYFDGDPFSPRSRIWLYGLRNPYRFALRPHPSGDDALYIGDVGWNTYEEITIVQTPGANLGWPCYEAAGLSPQYPGLDPPAGGCDTIGSKDNPGPLAAPVIWWHHFTPAHSSPAGFIGRAVVCGVFHENDNYPSPYRGGLFFADFIHNWIRVMKVDEKNQLQAVLAFATGAQGPVDFAIDPLTGSVCYVALMSGQVMRIDSFIRPGDVTRDGAVNIEDLLAVINGWGPCPSFNCAADLDGDGTVNVDDLLEVINNWG